MPVAPDNAGPKTIPNYANVANRRDHGTCASGGKTFVGPVDDPFFIDLGVIFDGINIDKPGRPMIGLGNQGGGKDDISGYNTHAFALQVPFKDVTRDGRDVKRPDDDNSIVGVWATTERLSIKVNGSGKAKWKQVSRIGNPLDQRGDHPDRGEGQVQRDAPARRPARTSARRAEPRAGEAILNALFNLGIKENNRDDIVQALLTGVPGLTQISPQRRAGRHAEGQPRHAADRQPEPLRRARR